MAYLPVRFPPTSTHSWPGYLLTLARKNGLRDISRLCAILGVTEPYREICEIGPTNS